MRFSLPYQAVRFFISTVRARGPMILFFGLLLILPTHRVMFAGVNPGSADLSEMNRVAGELQKELHIQNRIEIVIVKENDRLVSVTRDPDNGNIFRICFDREFLRLLTTEEVRTAIAHELGHVWIYTHHPYLQTEKLANRIALRVVNQENLDRLYNKSNAFLEGRKESRDASILQATGKTGPDNSSADVSGIR